MQNDSSHISYNSAFHPLVVVALGPIMADGDQKETDDPGEPVGPLDENFEFKKSKEGTIDKHVVICTHRKHRQSHTQVRSRAEHQYGGLPLVVVVYSLRSPLQAGRAGPQISRHPCIHSSVCVTATSRCTRFSLRI